MSEVPDDSKFVRALLKCTCGAKGGRDNILTIKEILTYLEEPQQSYTLFLMNLVGMRQEAIFCS